MPTVRDITAPTSARHRGARLGSGVAHRLVRHRRSHHHQPEELVTINLRRSLIIVVTEWRCSLCSTFNDEDASVCIGCFASR